MILGRTGFARKGNWIAAVTYDALDIVTHEGKVYIGRRESVGSEPSSESNDWVMLPGAPSFEIEETASGYDLTITGSDGTSETISILNGEVDREELEDALEAFRSSTDAYLAPDYDDTATYSIGDSCIYEGRLYRCIEDIPTAESWTAEHWEPVVLADKLAQMRKDAEVKADVVVSSAEPGDVISFDDGADNVPVKELVVRIEPVQDLHGQTNPYPPGGGTNLLDPSKVSVYGGAYGLSFTFADGLVTISGTATTTSSSASFNVIGYSDYSLSGKSYAVQYFDKTGTGTVKNVYGLRTENERSIAVTMDFSSIQEVNLSIKISVSATSQTEYHPYSNVCSISGWTGVEAYQAGKNLLDDSIKTIAGSRLLIGASAVTDNPTYLKQGEYSISVFGVNAVYAYLMNKNIALKTIIANKNNGTFTVDSDGYYRIDLYGNNAISGNVTGVMLVCGSEYAPIYEPYNGNTYPVSWQTEAGTVYGGSLNLTTGVLTVNYKYYTNSGTGNWGEVSTNGSRYYIGGVSSDAVNADTTGVCNLGLLVRDYYQDGVQVSNNGRINLCGSLYSAFASVDALKTYLSSNPLQVVYKLATPLTYQLTPTQIRLLFGVNTFWSNSNGGIQSLRYVSDLKLYLEQLTKPTEDDMIANSNIPANTYFTIGNALYLSTAAIAAGEKIEPDTNCTRKSLADALNDLHD